MLAERSRRLPDPAAERARINRWLRERTDFRTRGLQLCRCGLIHARADGAQCRDCQAEARGERSEP